MRHWLSLITLLFSVHIPAQELNTHQYLPLTTRSGLLIENIGGEVQLTHNTQKLFPPASTAKLLTALATKIELEDSFHFKTALKTNRKDVIITFSGDPLLTYDDLYHLFQQMKGQLGADIKGNIWLDNSMFTGYQKAVGWPWDILGVCYSAPSSAITIDGNCVQGSIYSLNNGKTRVHTPEQFPIVVSTSVKSISAKEKEHQQCDLELLSNQENHYQLTGCITKRKGPISLKFAVQNPDLYAKRMVYKILNSLNITLAGQVLVGLPDNTKNIKTVVTHQSPNLPFLLERMLKKSDNLIANNLTKALGQHFFGQAGSFTNGTEAIKQILSSKANIDLSSAQLYDGSGLSRNNRLTANQIAAVLEYIVKHDNQLHLLRLLPIAGESGTLKYRRSMRNKKIRGKIMAKSGSLYGSYNMAGYGLDKNGRPKSIFVQLITDYFPDRKEKQATLPLTNFESAFYQKVLSNR